MEITSDSASSYIRPKKYSSLSQEKLLFVIGEIDTLLEQRVFIPSDVYDRSMDWAHMFLVSLKKTLTSCVQDDSPGYIKTLVYDREHLMLQLNLPEEITEKNYHTTLKEYASYFVSLKHTDLAVFLNRRAGVYKA